MLHREAEDILCAIKARDINSTATLAQSTAVDERPHARSSVPQFLHSPQFESIEHHILGSLGPIRRAHLRIITAKLTAGKSEYNSIHNDGRKWGHQVP